MNNNKYYCGTITIVGQPNTGKSTLLNKLIGDKISIISKKLHTTQECIKGIKTNGYYQSIYIDTPGIKNKKYYITNIIQKKIDQAIYNSDLVIFVITKITWNIDDKLILKKIKKKSNNIILVINKIDIIKNKNILLPYVTFLNKQFSFIETVFVSAKTGENIELLSTIIQENIPKSLHQFNKDQITDNTQNFVICEIIREKIIYFLRHELPYVISLTIKNIKIINNRMIINVIIFVKNVNQKKILIGNKGEKIKLFSILSRKTLEIKFKTKVSLYLWVQIK